MQSQRILDQMAGAGLVVSLAYGPCGDKGICWSVDVLNTDTQESFENPFAANDFDHAVEIAKIEAWNRGWLCQLRARR